MARVMTRCPKTGQVIFTKMESSPKWFETYKLNDKHRPMPKLRRLAYVVEERRLARRQIGRSLVETLDPPRARN